MAQEPATDYGKIIGDIIWWIVKLLWKISLMLLWGLLRIVELTSGQFAKWLKGNV